MIKRTPLELALALDLAVKEAQGELAAARQGFSMIGIEEAQQLLTAAENRLALLANACPEIAQRLAR